MSGYPKEFETRVCSACMEEDYMTEMAKIDGKWHCNACWHEAMEVMEYNIIREAEKKHG